MTVQNDELFETGAAADADLILRTRSGDGAAFGELWRRHYRSGISVARSVTSSIDPDDLVQEAYTRIYQAIIKGGGPNGSFRAYLFTSIRNTAAAWGRSRRETAIDELDTVPDPDSTEQAANEALDRSLTAQAFRSLPTRWQEVLWYTEIEQMKPAEVGPLLGMKSGAVSQLAFRAREGLREAWIQAHLRSAEPGSECHWTIEHLGAYSRGNLSARDQKRLDLHIEDCARCMIVAAEAKDVSNRLALVLLPLVLGVAGAAGYTAMLQGAGAPVVALAAMPSSVMEGAVTVGGAAVGGTAANGTAAGIGAVHGNGGSAGSGAGGSAGGSAGTSGGALTGIGALVGAGSAALVVAGVVAAATIVPGLFNASPVTSMPSAGDSDSSSISSEVTPDSALDTEEKFVLKIPEHAPKTTPKTEPAPELEIPFDSDAPAVRPSVPTPATPDDGREGEGGTGPTESEQPQAPAVPEPEPSEAPEPEQPAAPEPTPEPEQPVEPADPGPPAEPEQPTAPEPSEPPAVPVPTPTPTPEPSPPIPGPPAPAPGGDDGGTDTNPGDDGGTDTNPGDDGGTDTNPGDDGDTDTNPGDDGGTDTNPGDDGDTDTNPGDDGDTDTNPGDDGDTDTNPGDDGDTDTNPGDDGDTDTNPGDDGDTDTNPGDAEPVLPAGSPSAGAGTQWCSPDDSGVLAITHVDVPLTGAPNAKVTARIIGLTTTSTFTTTLDANGTGVIELRPSADHLLLAAFVEFFYVDGDQTGEVTGQWLSDLFDYEVCELRDETVPSEETSPGPVEESTTDESNLKEPAIEEPTAEEPAIDEPTAEEPGIDEPTAEEPAIDEPTAEEPAIDEPTAEEPAIDEPTAEEPAIDEPTAEEPAIDEPTAEDPVPAEDTTPAE